MVLFPNCKINLGLNVISKRTDGYHDLETVFYPVNLRDVLEVIQANETSFYISGLPVDGNIQDNLCLKAYHLLKKDFTYLPPAAIHLHKAIPLGAGLGGGSSDGAFMLQMINKKFELNLSEEQLLNYALQLGSDCPFFIINKPCFATGRGENLTPVPVDLSCYKILFVNPGVHVSTKEGYSNLFPALPEKRIPEIIKQPISTWKDDLVNDFEKNVFEKFPAIKEIKDRLYDEGAVYSSMTGSGSTVFGFFEKSAEVNLTFAKDYLCITIE